MDIKRKSLQEQTKQYKNYAYVIGILTKNFSCLSWIADEKSHLSPIVIRTDKVNYRVASLLKKKKEKCI